MDKYVINLELNLKNNYLQLLNNKMFKKKLQINTYYLFE